MVLFEVTSLHSIQLPIPKISLYKKGLFSYYKTFTFRAISSTLHCSSEGRGSGQTCGNLKKSETFGNLEKKEFPEVQLVIPCVQYFMRK